MVCEIASGAYLSLSESNLCTVGVSRRCSWGSEVGGNTRWGTSHAGVACVGCRGNGVEGTVAVLPKQFPMG